jgi:hypothetical protein
MKSFERPLPLKNAPLQYAPDNELGVVFLFSRIAKRRRIPGLPLWRPFRIEQIRAAHPECIAYQHNGKRVRIEFEFRSSGFKTHGHNLKQCDYIVCWHHDWRTAPRHIKVIELKRAFGLHFKVWIQAAIKDQQWQLDERKQLDWALSTLVTPGDLLLMYRAYPSCRITDIFRFSGRKLRRGAAGWRSGYAHFGRIKRVCKLDSPVSLDDLRGHKVLRTAPFVRGNMQGKSLRASECWRSLYSMIYERNPRIRKRLAKYAPEKVG